VTGHEIFPLEWLNGLFGWPFLRRPKKAIRMAKGGGRMDNCIFRAGLKPLLKKTRQGGGPHAFGGGGALTFFLVPTKSDGPLSRRGQ